MFGGFSFTNAQIFCEWVYESILPIRDRCSDTPRPGFQNEVCHQAQTLNSVAMWKKYIERCYCHCLNLCSETRHKAQRAI